MGFNNSDLTTGSDPAFPQAMPASWPCVDAWYEQRMFILNAVQALVAGKSPCAPPMTKAMAEISPSWASGEFRKCGAQDAVDHIVNNFRGNQKAVLGTVC